MRSSPLRDLSRRYATGNLSRKDYVTRRTQLILKYTNGQLDITYRESRPVVLVRKQGIPYWVPVLALVAGITVTLLIWSGTKEPQTRDAGPAAAGQPLAAPAAAGEKNLIGEFLAARNWTDPELEQLENSWRNLPAFRQEALRRTPDFRRLESRTRRKLEEVQALRALNDSAESRLRETRLREFAAELGLEITP